MQTFALNCSSVGYIRQVRLQMLSKLAFGLYSAGIPCVNARLSVAPYHEQRTGSALK